MTHFPHLWDRKGRYYFRIAVPTLLIPRFERYDLAYSLKTKSYTEAKVRCWAMLRVAQLVFEKIATMPELTPEQVKAITQGYFKECLNRMECQLDTLESYESNLLKWSNSVPSGYAAHMMRSMQADRSDFLLPDNFQYDNKQDTEEVTGIALDKPPYFHNGDSREILNHLIEKNELDIQEGTPPYKLLNEGVERVIFELDRLRRARGLSKRAEIKDEWFREPKPLSIVPVSSCPNISEVFKEYLLESERNKENERTIKRKRAAYDIWLILIGDNSISAITKREAKKYKDAISKMPSNIKKRYPDKSIQQVLQLNIPDNERMEIQTINDYLGKMQACFTWAMKNYDEIDSNPFVGLFLKDKTKKKQKKDSFSEDQLKAIFSTPVFKGCKGDKQTERYVAGKIIIKDAMYWVPLIALYSGARMSEILQLHVSDLKKIKDIWIFDINDEEEDQRLKTSGSKRKVPIHPKLISLGLLDHKMKLEENDSDRMFPDVPLSSDNTYSNAFSKKFSNFLKRFDIKTDKTSFQSFRHTVKDAFLKTNVSAEIRKAIMGHVEGDVHSDYGSAEYPIKKLHSAIKQLKFPLLNSLIETK